MAQAIYIPDEIEKAVTKTSVALKTTLGSDVQYMFGHPLEIVANLQEMTASPSNQNKKYPLVALFTDIPITVSDNTLDFYGRARFTIIIATLTQNTFKAKDRLEKSFKPVLQPIKIELLKQIGLLPQFTVPGEIGYTEIEHYYWGRQGLYGNQANIFNDWIDCIELRDIQVNVNSKICNTVKINI